jgi:hypothetical protein
MKFALLALVTLSSTAWSAELCTVNSPSFICQSRDGKTAIEISAARNVTGISNNNNSFCTQSYLKLDDHEINGARSTAVDADSVGLSSVDAITSATRMRITNPATHRPIYPVSVIHYVLNSSVEGSDRGSIFIFANDQGDQYDADLYLYNADQVVAYKMLACE